MVDSDTMGDRVDPRRQLGTRIEIAEATKHPEKRFLGQILHRSALAGRPPEHRAHHPGVFLHEGRARVLVALQASPHQFPLVTVHPGGPFLDETGVAANGFTSGAETFRRRRRLISHKEG
jgi:hypothetical protein